MSRLTPPKAEVKLAIPLPWFSEISPDASRCPNGKRWLEVKRYPSPEAGEHVDGTPTWEGSRTLVRD
jgi:hypothetical protein